MVLLPLDPELSKVNFDSFLLQIGTNPDIYTMLQDVSFHLERPEISRFASGTTSSPAIYRITFVGPSTNHIEATLLMSLSEFITFATTYFNLDANRTVPIEFFRIVMTDINGTTKTIGNTANTPPGFKARLKAVEVTKPVLGAVKYRINLQLLEDTITIS